MDEVLVEDAFFVHLFDERTDFLVGKLANVVAEENLVFSQRSQRGGRGGLQGIGHEAPSSWKWADC